MSETRSFWSVIVVSPAITVSSSGSGWAGQSGGIVQTSFQTDHNIGSLGEVMANNANQHLATVPVDLLSTEGIRGQHPLMLSGGQSTWIDQGDYGHVAVLEWVNPDAPMFVGMNPPLQNAPANSQEGGGGVIAQSQFTSDGGTLLVRANCSVWTQNAPCMLEVGIQIDGVSQGFLGIFANFSTTHMTAVSNDLVLTNVPAGQHTLTLLAEEATITDSNDRVSVMILEFLQSS